MSWTQSSSPSHSRQLWLLFLLVLLVSGGLYYVLSGQAHQQALRAAAAQAQLQAQLQTQLDRLHQRANITELTVRDLAADSVTTRQLTVTGATNLQDLFASSLTTSGNLSSASLGSDSANFGTLLVRGATTLAGPTRFKDTATFAKIIDLGVLRLTDNDRDLVLIQPSVNNGQNVFVLRSPTGAELAALTASGNLSLAGGLTAAAVTTATATISGVLNVTQADITQANINAANIGTLTTTGQATFTATPVGTLVNQGSLYINPASAGAADTLLGLAVAGTQKFKVDASGNVYANNIVLNGSVTSGNTTASNLTVLNNTVLGTTAANTTTVNSTTTFNAPVTNNGSLTQNGISTFNSNVTVAANLNVSGATTLNNGLSVTGNGTFAGTVTAAGFNGPISGTITPTGSTQGSVVFAGASGTLTQDNANFFWDNVNKRLGLGTGAPGTTLDVAGTGDSPVL